MRLAATFWGCVLLSCGAQMPAFACPGHPGAIGTSRTIVVDPREHSRLGTMQYGESLPLADKEVVLTFDDGPLPPYTDRILDILASECVKATYFIVGRMARAYPDRVRRIRDEGHTIGTHSQNHPFTFHTMPLTLAEREIEDGISTTAATLGTSGQLAPFFRIPGLLRSKLVEDYLAARGLMTWSADFPADDWKHRITDKEIVRRAMQRLEAKGKGILLLHDIHPATALALPQLFAELKAGGYRIVRVVPATAERPKTASEPAEWIPLGPGKTIWPPVASMIIGLRSDQFKNPIAPFGPRAVAAAPFITQPRSVESRTGETMPPGSLWPSAPRVHAVLRTVPDLVQPDIGSLGTNLPRAGSSRSPGRGNAKAMSKAGPKQVTRLAATWRRHTATPHHRHAAVARHARSSVAQPRGQ